jgi:WD40 repeat protein
MKTFLLIIFSIFSFHVYAQDTKATPVSIKNRSLTIAVSPDAKLMVAYDRSPNLSLWNAESGKYISDIITASQTAAIVFLNNNQILVTSEDSTLRIINTDSGKTVENFKTGAAVWLSESDSSGQKILTRGMTDVFLFDRQDHKTIFSYNVDFLMGATISSNGQYIAFATTDTVFIYTTTGKLIAAREGRFNMMQPVFSPDNKLLFTSNYSEGALYEVPTAKLLHILEGHDATINYAVFHPTKKELATCSDDSTVKIWNTNNGELIATLMGHKGEVNHAEYNSDGSKLLTTALDKTAVNERKVIIWNTKSKHKDHEIKLGKLPVHTAVFNRDGNKVLIDFLHSEPPRIVDVATNSFTSLSTGVPNVTAASFNMDGSKIYSLWDDKVTRITDIQTGGVTEANVQEYYKSVYTGFFSADNKRVLVHAGMRGIEVWDTASKTKLFALDSTHFPTTAQYSRDGKYIITGSMFYDKTVLLGKAHPKLWNANTSELIKVLEGHEGGVNQAVFSFDNKFAATASDDSTTKVWDVNSLQLIADFKHAGKVNTVAFSTNSSYLVTSTVDGYIHLYDLELRKIASTLKVAEGKLKSVSVDPTAKKILTVSSTGKMHVLDVLTRKIILEK